MSTAENKLNLLQMIIESDDKNFIDRLSSIALSLTNNKSADWADELPDQVMEELLLSIEEAEEGTANAEMLNEARKEFPFLRVVLNYA